MKTCIIQIAKEILKKSGVSFVLKKDTSRWNEEVKTVNKENKKKCNLALVKCMNEDLRQV